MWTTFKDVATKLHGKGYTYRDTEKNPELKKKINFVSFPPLLNIQSGLKL